MSARRSRAAGKSRGDTSPPREVGCAVIGLGLMGAIHVRAIEAARAGGVACKLVAVVDRNRARLDGRTRASGNVRVDAGGERLFDPARVHATTRVADVLASPDVHAVSICTHTDTHVELALAAIAAGKHVLVEKPVALDARDVLRVAKAARAAGKLAMPAMCMRFWPGWDWLAERVRDRSFGRVKSAVFQRLASAPAWARHFYRDARKSGGALVDLHVHDADFVHRLFGAPDAVATTGGLDHVTTAYRYAKGPAHVVAEGGWDHASGFPFRMRYVVVFEKATADFELGREPRLLLHRDGKSTKVAIDDGDGYRREVEHFLCAILRGDTAIEPSMEEAASVMHVLAAERASLGR